MEGKEKRAPHPPFFPTTTYHHGSGPGEASGWKEKKKPRTRPSSLSHHPPPPLPLNRGSAVVTLTRLPKKTRIRRTWQEIAEALEVPHGKVALELAWAPTRKAVASGKLVIPKRAATKPAIASHVFSSLRPDRYFISATARLWSAGYPLRSGYAQLWDERATDGTDMVWTAHGSLPLSTDMVWSLHYCHDNGTVGTYGGQIVGAAS